MKLKEIYLKDLVDTLLSNGFRMVFLLSRQDTLNSLLLLLRRVKYNKF